MLGCPPVPVPQRPVLTNTHLDSVNRIEQVETLELDVIDFRHSLGHDSGGELHTLPPTLLPWLKVVESPRAAIPFPCVSPLVASKNPRPIRVSAKLQRHRRAQSLIIPGVEVGGPIGPIHTFVELVRPPMPQCAIPSQEEHGRHGVTPQALPVGFGAELNQRSEGILSTPLRFLGNPKSAIGSNSCRFADVLEYVHPIRTGSE